MVKRVSGDDRRSISRWIAKLGRYNRLTSKRRAKIARAKLRLPYRRLGHGVHRLVYDLGNGFVLKVAISLRGMKCNELEHRLYASCTKPIKKHLCPVVEFGQGWIVMKKMKVPCTGKHHKLKLLRKKFRKAGILPKDMRRANLATYKGRIVVVDYGNFIMDAAKPVTKPAKKPSRRRGCFFVPRVGWVCI
jgi:hypothetical protein